MIRLLEENYRKMEQIIRVLSISDEWMTKKEMQKKLEALSQHLLLYRRDQNSLGNESDDRNIKEIRLSDRTF